MPAQSAGKQTERACRLALIGPSFRGRNPCFMSPRPTSLTVVGATDLHTPRDSRPMRLAEAELPCYHDDRGKAATGMNLPRLVTMCGQLGDSSSSVNNPLHKQRVDP